MPLHTSLPNIDVYSLDLTNTIGTKTISLKKIFLELDIYESIQDHYMKGEIILIDTFDLQVNFPLIGNETLEIKLNDQSESMSKSLTFKIYKLEDAGLYRGMTNKKIIKLFFVSDEAIKNEQTKISKKFTGTSETILTNIVTSNLYSSKNIELESTGATSHDIYCNFWRPSKVINLILKKSKNILYKDYIFYEDFDGFKFKTLSALMNQSAKQTIDYSILFKQTTKTSNMKMFKFNSNFDVLANTHHGLFGTTFYKPHETDYSYTKTTDTFKDIFSNIVGLGNNLIYDDSLSNSNSCIKVTYLDTDISSIRNVSFKTIENYKKNIKLNGDLDRRVGDILNIKFPTFDSDSYTNNNFNGNYIIMKIKHIIKNNGQYEQNLLVGKNAFFSNNKMSSETTLKNV